MQTFTLFFGLAIVAIAMENLTSKFLFVKKSNADAKGLQELHSRAEGTFKYSLRGVTGKEKVTITDGNETEKHDLEVKDKPFFAKNPRIIIDFTNDECCEPDRNVMFTTSYEKKIITANNPFPQNFETKWNCSSCPDKSNKKTKERMDLISRMDLKDRCDTVRNTTDDFCDNCEILKGGQFCHPGKYTVEFKTKGHCRGVTFGGCEYPPTLISGNREDTEDAQQCSQLCSDNSNCNFYRYNHVTRNCTFLMMQNRGLYCNIWAAPREQTGTQCLNIDNNQFCDYQLQEECDYNGNVLERHQPGEITSSMLCQLNCKHYGSRCKSWIHHKNENLCILMKDELKECTTWGGLKSHTFDDCAKANREN